MFFVIILTFEYGSIRATRRSPNLIFLWTPWYFQKTVFAVGRTGPATAAEEFPARPSPRAADVQGAAKPCGETPHSDENIYIFNAFFVESKPSTMVWLLLKSMEFCSLSWTASYLKIYSGLTCISAHVGAAFGKHIFKRCKTAFRHVTCMVFL